MAIEKTINIKVNSGQAEASIKKVDSGVKDVNKSTTGLTNTLDKFTGGAVTKLKNFKGALGGVATGFKSVGVAIAASGIGLLVVTIAAVTSAFKASEEGQNKFAKIMGVIGSVVGNLTDLLSDFGELVISAFENPKKAISDFANLIKENIVNRFEGLIELIPNLGKAINLLFKGQFSEAGKVAADAVGKVTLGVESITEATQKAIDKTKEFITELEREAEIAAMIADQRAQAEKIERDLIVQRAEADRKIAELREIAARRDLYNLEQRKNALIEAARINDEITSKEIIAAKLRRDAIIQENTLSKSNKDALKEEEEAKAAVIRLETQRLQLSKRLGTELSAINQQEISEAKALLDAKIKAREDEINGFQKNFDKLEIDNLKAKEKEKIDIIKKTFEDKKKFAEDEKALDQAVADAKAGITQDVYTIIQGIAEEGSAVGKGVAAAQATISAISGINSTLATPTTIPEPFGSIAKIAQATAIGVTGFNNVKRILAVDPKGVSGSGGANVDGGRGASAPSFNLVQGTGTNQIAQSLQQQDAPIKAYVVTSDVTSGQSLDRNIVENASLG